MKIYVDNLAFGATEDELREVFREFGTVASVIIPIHGPSRLSSCQAIIEMPDRWEAWVAIQLMNGNQHRGLSMEVSEKPPGYIFPTRIH